MKKDIKFRDLSILNVTLLFVKSVLLGTRKTHIYLLHTCNLCNFHNRRYMYKMELTVKPADKLSAGVTVSSINNVFICRCISCICCFYYMLILFMCVS